MGHDAKKLDVQDPDFGYDSVPSVCSLRRVFAERSPFMQTSRLFAAIGVVVVITLMIPAVATAQVRVEKNVIYGMFSGTALLLDVHFPARPNGFGIIHVA